MFNENFNYKKLSSIFIEMSKIMKSEGSCSLNSNSLIDRFAKSAHYNSRQELKARLDSKPSDNHTSTESKYPQITGAVTDDLIKASQFELMSEKGSVLKFLKSNPNKSFSDFIEQLAPYEDFILDEEFMFLREMPDLSADELFTFANNELRNDTFRLGGFEGSLEDLLKSRFTDVFCERLGETNLTPYFEHLIELARNKGSFEWDEDFSKATLEVVIATLEDTVAEFPNVATKVSDKGGVSVAQLFAEDQAKDLLEAEDEPYCMECGEDHDLAHIANFANGTEWRCNACSHTFLW